jgi:hypothetical protein
LEQPNQTADLVNFAANQKGDGKMMANFSGSLTIAAASLQHILSGQPVWIKIVFLISTFLIIGVWAWSNRKTPPPK